MIARFVQIARKDRLSYDGFLYVCQQARRRLGLRRPKRERKLPQLLTEADLKRFFRVIQDCGDVEHEIMLKFLFFTAVRVSELVKIKVGEVDLGSCKVFIEQGKGAKDRYILFPASFRLVLKSHLQANPKNRYLFETSRCGPFTPRRIQQIVQSYRAQAGLTQPVHPHLFRHQRRKSESRAVLFTTCRLPVAAVGIKDSPPRHETLSLGEAEIGLPG